MKRLLISLAVGVLGTVFLAWLCAAHSFVFLWYSPPTIDEATTLWTRYVPADSQWRLDAKMATRYVGVTRVDLYSLDDPNPNWTKMTGVELAIIDAGWPIRCLRGVLYRRTPPATVEAIGGWQIPPGYFRSATVGMIAQRGYLSTDYGVLPLTPLWWGIIIDVLFLATGVYLISLGARAWKRRLRRAAGRCLHCGHTLIPANTRCPECGGDRIT
jgi:hypothetical protein